MASIRRAGTTSGILLSVIGTAFVVAQLVAPRWTERAGLDVWNFPEWNRMLQETAEERERLREVQTCQDQEFAALDGVAARLAAGGLALPEAIDATEWLLGDRIGLESMPLPAAGGETARHRVARHLIARAKRIHPFGAWHWAATFERLRAEYARLA